MRRTVTARQQTCSHRTLRQYRWPFGVPSPARRVSSSHGMTEKEWQAATDPAPMLAFLAGQLSDRKQRLFACACCRRLWPHLPDGSRYLVAVSESYADDRQESRLRRAVEDAEIYLSGDGRMT